MMYNVGWLPFKESNIVTNIWRTGLEATNPRGMAKYIWQRKTAAMKD